MIGKTMENVRKHRDIKLVTTEKRKKYLMSEPHYHTTKFFTENLLAIETKKVQILMNKPVYLGLSILKLNKVIMYEFWSDYVKPKYSEKAKLCYLDTDSFIVYIKTNDIYVAVVENRFDTSNYELERPLSKGKNEKLIELMKDELGRKVMIDDGSEGKKAKDTKRCVIKRKLKFEIYENSLEATKLKNKINCLEEKEIDIDSFF